MKRLVSMILVLVMVFSLVPVVHAEVYKGSCGAGVNWTLDTATGVLKITGNGNIKDAQGLDMPWSSYKGSITSVVIDYGVTGIGKWAFYDCKKLTSISIPEGVTYIGSSAFQNCKALTSVKLPSTLTRIDSNGFCDAGLTAVEIPGSVETLGTNAFYGCANLKQVKLNYGLKTIGKQAFMTCKKLTALYMPDSVTYVGDGVCDMCDSLTSVRISNNVPELYLYSFRNCKNLVSLYLGTGLKKINSGVFYNCTSLKNTVLPEGLEHIHDSSFYNCDLRQIIIPASVNYVGGYAFGGNENLARVAVLSTKEIVPSGTAGTNESFGIPGYTEMYGYESTGTSSNMTAYENAMKYGFYFEFINEENLWRDYVEPAPNGEYAGGTEENPFKDVWNPNEYYYDPVLWAYENQITAGSTATTFEPDGFCQRGQVVTFLWRAMEKPEPSLTACPFLDVNKLEYYYTPILWAYEDEITMGTDATHFSPEDTVTRGQFVTFLWRAMGKPSASTNTGFTDVPAGEYYAQAVAWAVANGITQGTGNGKFSPNDTCTRAQVVAFLYRLLG